MHNLAIDKSNNKYQGDPLRDLNVELGEVDGEFIILNKDMDGHFEDMLPKQEETKDSVSSAESMQRQVDEILAKEREIESQRADEVRQSMTLDKLKQEQKSKIEIEK